ncbi:MAG: class I SAM-dependent methyltransferase [Armatimonadota bacterium]
MLLRVIKLFGRLLFVVNLASLWVLVSEGVRASREFLRLIWAAYLWRRTISRLPASELNLPEVSLDEVLPNSDAACVNLQYAMHRPGSLPLEELTALAIIFRCLQPKRIVEIGTSEGRTTLNLALNAPPDAEIITVDLPPELTGEHRKYSGPNYRQMNIEEPGALFRNHPAASKIKLVFADSTEFDWTPYERSVDFVFIDGAHDYESVRKDTENALKIIRPGGVIVWHDYGVWKGVTRCLDELRKQFPVVLLKDTTLAYLRVTESELQNFERNRKG